MGGGGDAFEKLDSVVTDGGVPLTKFRSKQSGLTVCIAEAEGPLVAGYLCVATEAHDDDGLPHTLEHLVFMGSEKYPYKGILDLLSNLCLASGTNAWTDTDHTCYTMTTAGHEGFLKLLPIYMDHLLFPTLTDAAFVTEVHHVNGEGEDGGVVYCEMQGTQNTGERRCHLAMLRAMYPGDCGYKCEIAGLLENLRKSTTNEKVKAFHKDYYRPENISVIIVGQINAGDVFKALQPIEDKILEAGERPPFSRPWQSPVPPLEQCVTLDVNYPCDEDEFGLVLAAWRGPNVTEYPKLIAVQVLMEYLMDTSISPLQREFVETLDPLCSNVDYTLIENSVSCIYLHFSNVPAKKLSLVKSRLLSVLSKIADGTEAIDMKRMATVIHKKELYILSRMESHPHKQIALCLIGDFLYSSSPNDLKLRLQQIPLIRKLSEETEEYWRSLLKQFMVDGNHVFILGYPSPSLAKEMADEEKQRVEEQRDQLGLEGLKSKGEILRRSMEQNEIPPPDELMHSVSVPSVESIKFHSIQRYNNHSENTENPEDFPMVDMPCRFQLDFVQTNFVRIYVLLDTGEVPPALRLYLPLFVELIIESAVKRNGEIVSHQDVVRELAADTIDISVSVGFDYRRFSCQEYAQVICLELVLEEEKYLKGVQWIREILYQTVFEPARVKTIANKMLSDVSSMRRNGHSVVKTLVVNLCFTSESNHWVTSMMRQCRFLTDLCKELESHPDEVIKALNDLREIVTRVEKMTVHLAVNPVDLKSKMISDKPWAKSFLPDDVKPVVAKCSLKQCYELLEDFKSEQKMSATVGLSCVESSFILLAAPCINSYMHKDYPALLMLIQYLTQLEGPLWRRIRGMGLAYDYKMFVKPNQGLIYFLLYRSALPVKAYKETLKIIESYLNKETTWDQSLLESASSSLVFEIVEREKTVADVVSQSATAYYKGVDMNYTKELLKSISKVTTEDMERVGSQYLRPLFDPKQSKCSICCSSLKVNEVVSGFKQCSRELNVLSSLEDSLLAEY